MQMEEFRQKKLMFDLLCK